MTTEIFSSFEAFEGRADRQTNGVSAGFAGAKPETWETGNASNVGCWNCLGCHDCVDCVDSHACAYSIDCVECLGCVECRGWKDSVGCYWGKPSLNVPIVSDLHQQVLAAREQPGALNMSTWHKCSTTHCRAGWIVTLAGAAGKELEDATSTLFAAMQICRVSSTVKVSPSRFFETDSVAMEDIKRCAAAELSMIS